MKTKTPEAVKRKHAVVNIITAALIILTVVGFAYTEATAVKAKFKTEKSLPQTMVDSIMFSMRNIFEAQLSDASEGTLVYRMVFDDSSVVVMAGQIFAMLAVVLMIVNLFVNAIRRFENDETPGLVVSETIYKSCVYGIFVVSSLQIAKGVAAIGLAISGMIMNAMTTATTEYPAVTLEMLCGVKSPSLAMGAALTMVLIFPWCMSLLVKLLSYVTVYSLVIEMGLRKALFPFAVANICSDGIRGPGMRSAKHYLNTFIRVGVAAFVISLISSIDISFLAPMEGDVSDWTTTVTGTAITNCLTYVLISVVMNAVCVSFVLKSEMIVNDVIG